MIHYIYIFVKNFNTGIYLTLISNDYRQVKINET